jgi:hypothetical protein
MKPNDVFTMLMAHIGLCILLAIGIFDLPYGYYQFLRIFMILGSFFSITVLWGTRYKYLSLIYVSLIILFNPIVKLAFSKPEWKVVDGIVSLIMFGLMLFIKVKLKRKPIKP